MLCEEVQILVARPIVSQPVRSDVLTGEHLLKEPPAVAPTLHGLSNVEVQNAARCHLERAARMVYEQLLDPVLDDAEASVALILKYKSVLVALQLAKRGERTS